MNADLLFPGDQVVDRLSIGGGEGTLQAGIRETVTIDVSLAEQPYDAMSVVLTFARVADGDALVVPATASVRPGLWTADVLLPDGGTWTVAARVVTPDGIEREMALNAIQVGKAPALPPSTTPVTPPAAPPAPPILPIALGLAGIAAAALLGLGMRDRIRRRVSAPVGSAATADRA